jgi:putative oxidoreductase
MIHHITQFRYHKAMGLLLVRLAAGAVFINHGWMKLQNLSGAEGFFAGLGLPPGAATLVAVIEVVGGIMLAAGVAPRIAGLVLGVEMIVAMLLVGIPRGSYELEMVLAAASLAIFLAGAGRYALYSMERE